MAFKLVISNPQSGASVQKDIADDATKNLIGLKIGDTVKGELIDLHGYEFLLTGGSDYCGFPMRKDVPGVGRKRILSYQGVGLRKTRKGMLQRKTVCGNTVHAKTVQINMKVLKLGTENIFETLKKKDEEKKTEKAEPKKEMKEEVKKEKSEVKPDKVEKKDTVKATPEKTDAKSDKMEKKDTVKAAPEKQKTVESKAPVSKAPDTPKK